MGNLQQINGFNADQVDQGVLTHFEPIPMGAYTCIVTKSSFDRNKNGTGLIARIQYAVIDGPYKDRVLFDNFNIRHQTPMAQKIGEAQFAELCTAVGKTQIQDTSELHNLPFIADVTIEKRKDTGEAQNTVKKRRSLNGSAKPYQPRQQEQAPVAQQPPAAGNAAPWAR